MAIPANLGSILRDAWLLVGPLVGVLVGAYVTSRSQRRQWINDNRKEEYRELLAAITRAWMLLFDNARFGHFEPETLPEYYKSLQTLQDRVFIAREIKKLNLFDRWGESVKALHETAAIGPFEEKFEK